MLRAIDHVQIAIPVGGEDAARPFYRDLLGLTEVAKTGVQAARGGCWFETGGIKVHLGVEEPFRANRKAHVAFVVDDVSGLGERASAAGYETKSDDDLEGYERVFIYDPFGNRLEFLAPFPLDGGRAGDGGGRLSSKSPEGVKAEAATPQPFARARHATGAVERARRLRAEMTLAERVLWKELRRLKINFRRQAPIGRFVADFVHFDSKLIVEIDGYYHDDPERQARDLQRTAWLQSQGFRVIRFPEKDVRDQLSLVVERIVAEAAPPPIPDPSPIQGEGRSTVPLMLSIKNLHATVGGTEILKGLSLDVPAGEVHAIMGPNGAGKSTLSYVLTGREGYEVTQGSATLDGVDILSLEPNERAAKGVFLSFQYPLEIPGVPALTFVRTALNSQRKARGEAEVTAPEFLKLARAAAQSLKMDFDMLKRPLNVGFSGGEKKRMEILQMAMLAPRFAILDETDSGLDIDALRIVAEGVNAMRGPDRAMLVITHYQRLLEYIRPDRVHVLAGGRIVASGGPELALELEREGYDKYARAA